jgi:endogenous inhibitor of DNA gyrase (YacG/DUF329 family)
MRYDRDGEFDRSDYSTTPISRTQPVKSSGMAERKKLCCPICDRLFSREATPAMPFCSVRCQQIDLGRWFNESYGMPYEGEDRPGGFDSSEDDAE